MRKDKVQNSSGPSSKDTGTGSQETKAKTNMEKSSQPASSREKAKLVLIRDEDEEAAVAAMFEGLTGRKLTEAEMREARKTLAEPPEGTTTR